MMGKEIPITAARLHNEGLTFVVSLEIGGKWVEVIREATVGGGLTSHTVEALGMLDASQRAQGIQ